MCSTRRNWLAAAWQQEVRSAAKWGLPGLYVVLGLAATTAEILVQRAGTGAGDVGDDKARFGALGAGLDAGDDARDAAPVRRAIEELLVAPQLAVCGTTGASGRGAVHPAS